MVLGLQYVPTVVSIPPVGGESWTDLSGNLWLFGGDGFDFSTNLYQNDLVQYSPPTGAATLVAGSTTLDAAGVYGTLGVAASTNMPGARAAGTDSSGNLWLFGGYQIDAVTNARREMNDLWKYPIQ